MRVNHDGQHINFLSKTIDGYQIRDMSPSTALFDKVTQKELAMPLEGYCATGIWGRFDDTGVTSMGFYYAPFNVSANEIKPNSALFLTNPFKLPNNFPGPDGSA